MFKLQKVYILLFCVLFMISCGQKEINLNKSLNYEVPIININPHEISNKEEIKLSELIDTFKVLPLEHNKNIVIGMVKKIIVSDTIIVLLDSYSNCIYVFNNKGDFISKISNIGKGPGEFLDITDFAYNNDLNQIIIFDKIRSILLTFDINGKFLGQEKIDLLFKEFSYINKEKILLYNDYQHSSTDLTFNIFDYNMSNEKIIGMFPYTLEDNSNRTFTKNTFFQFSNGITYYSPLFNNIIYKFVDNQFIPVFKIDFGKFNLNRNESSEVTISSTPNKVLLTENFYENKNSVYFEFVYKWEKRVKVWLDKNSNKIIYPHQFKYDIPFVPWTTSIQGCYNDMFITTLPSETITRRIDTFNQQCKDNNINNPDSILNAYSPELYDISKNQSSGKTVIFFYKLKAF